MNTLKLISLAALTTLMFGCASTAYQPKVDFDRNDKVVTTDYKTFAWLNEDKILASPAAFNPVMKARFDEAIEQAFVNRGYKLVDSADQADFTISYSIGSRDKVKSDSLPASYRASWGWGHRYYGGIYVADETRVKSYQEGKLAIDVFDVKTKAPVWHGWAIQRIRTKDEANPGRVIVPTVEQIVATF